MEKRGLSGIVVTMLLVVTGIAFVIIAYSTILPIIQSSQKNSITEEARMKIFSSIDKNSICYTRDPATTKFQLEIVRNSGEGDVEGIQLIFLNATSQYAYTVLKRIRLNERARITVSLVGNITNVESVEAYSLIKTEDGSNVLGSIKDTYEVKGTEIGCP